MCAWAAWVLEDGGNRRRRDKKPPASVAASLRTGPEKGCERQESAPSGLCLSEVAALSVGGDDYGVALCGPVRPACLCIAYLTGH